jgi:hypothetical protein
MWYRKRHVAEKFLYHIGNTDTTSVFSDTTSEIPKWYRKKTDVVSVFSMWYRKKPMWYRYFRCGIGIFPLRAFSDTTSEIISNHVCNNWFFLELFVNNFTKIQINFHIFCFSAAMGNPNRFEGQIFAKWSCQRPK